MQDLRDQYPDFQPAPGREFPGQFLQMVALRNNTDFAKASAQARARFAASKI